MTTLLIIAAVVVFAIAAILAFAGGVALTTILALIAIGLACYAAAAIVPNVA